MKKILISGATGHLGGIVLERLVAKSGNYQLAAMARNPEKLAAFTSQNVEIIQADFDDKASLLKAFQAIDIFYFVSGSDIEKRDKQHETVIEAAKESRVGHIVYTSFQRKNESEDSAIAPIGGTHLKTEKLLKESGLSYTFLRHSLYTDLIPAFIGEHAVSTGTIYFPAGNGKVAFASRTDMAEAAVTILSGEGHENKSYEISNTISWSFEEVAQILGKITGKEILYVAPSVDDYQKTLKEAEVPAPIIAMMSMFATCIAQGEFDLPDPALQKLINHQPQSLESFLKTVYGK